MGGPFLLLLLGSMAFFLVSWTRTIIMRMLLLVRIMMMMRVMRMRMRMRMMAVKVTLMSWLLIWCRLRWPSS